jgi:hypothetical protein
MSNENGYYSATTRELEKLRVPEIKNVLRAFSLSTTGRKQELIDRMKQFLTTALQEGNSQRIMAAYQTVIGQARGGGSGNGNGGNPVNRGPTPSRPVPSMHVQQPYTSQVNSINNSPQLPPRSYPHYQTGFQHPPYPPHSQHPRNSVADLKIKFKFSPFYKVLKMLHEPVLFERASAERRTLGRNFLLTENEIQAVLNKNYGIYIMSTVFDSRTGKQESLIQFPTSHVEIRVNNKPIVANLRGIKGVPGSALPIDVTDNVADAYNKSGKVRHTVDMAVGFPKEDYVISTYLVEPIKLESIIEDIKKRPPIKKDDTIKRIQQDNDDDDLVATTTFHSLVDPVTFSRIETPVRSTRCRHIDPIDAKAYLQLQMQGPTWKCTICNREIKFSDLVVDEYFKDVLNRVPRNADEVEIHPDGTWVVPKLNEDSSGSDSDSDEELAKRALRISQGGKPQERAQTAIPNRSSEPIVVELSDDDDDDGGGGATANTNNNSDTTQSNNTHNVVNDSLNGSSNNTEHINDNRTNSSNSAPANDINDTNNTTTQQQQPPQPRSRSEATTPLQSTSAVTSVSPQTRNASTAEESRTNPNGTGQEGADNTAHSAAFSRSSLLNGIVPDQSTSTGRLSPGQGSRPLPTPGSNNGGRTASLPFNSTNGSQGTVRSLAGMFDSQASSLLNPQQSNRSYSESNRSTNNNGSSSLFQYVNGGSAPGVAPNAFSFGRSSLLNGLTTTSNDSSRQPSASSTPAQSQSPTSTATFINGGSANEKQKTGPTPTATFIQTPQPPKEAESEIDRQRQQLGQFFTNNSNPTSPRPQPPIPTQSSRPPEPNPNKRGASEVIDLTLSDDDESPPAKR